MRVVVYARVSSEKQDVDLSVSAQLRALRQYAAANGSEVVAEYVDEAQSGRTANRPVFQEMIRDARQLPRPFDAILVWKMSRFARSREDSILYKSMLRKAGVVVTSINEPIDGGPTGQFFEGIIESMDEFYSANLAQDVTRGMREAASRGFWVSSQTPYGYLRTKVNDGGKERATLKIDTGPAAVVAEMFSLAVAGEGTKAIAVALNKRGVPSPRGKRWSRGGIHSVLTNPVYKGTLVFGVRGKYHRRMGLEPIAVENAMPSVVEPSLFESVQSMLQSKAPRVQHPRRAGSRYLLSGILYCDECGARMFGRSAKSGKYHYYVCGSLDRSGGGVCEASPLPKALIERAVLQRVLGVVLQVPNMERLVEFTNEELRREARSATGEADALSERLNDVRGRLRRLYEALETARLDLDDLAPRIKDLRDQERELAASSDSATRRANEREIRLINKEALLVYLIDLRSLLSAGTPEQRKSFLASFLKRVSRNGEEVEIEYELPLPSERARLSGDGVLPIDLNGGPCRIRTDDLRIKSPMLYQLS